MPNPKKSFTGRVLEAKNGKAKFLFVGGHFPVHVIGKALDQADTDKALEDCKYIIARHLRRVLVRAHQAGMLDGGVGGGVVGYLVKRLGGNFLSAYVSVICRQFSCVELKGYHPLLPLTKSANYPTPNANTLVVLAGDLNSRCVLPNGVAVGHFFRQIPVTAR